MSSRRRAIKVLCSRPYINKERVLYAVYIALFPYLILYSIFFTFGIAPISGPPDTYDIENVAVRLINCSFNISSQYQKTPRYICYFLLIFTIVIRNHKWLAAGAAASVMTYSGVTAIHIIILFATKNRFHLQTADSGCQSVLIPGMSDPFFACQGVHEPDVVVAGTVLSIVMLGALPMAALSSTFKKTTGRVILIFWLLLLAIGHTFSNLAWPIPDRQFQVCLKDHVEPLPVPNYQPPLLDQSWVDAFQSLIAAAQQPPQHNANGSSPACIYSCFATISPVGRRQQDISIPGPAGYLPGPFLKIEANGRLSGSVFWWLYTVLAFLSLFTTENIEKRGHLPRWVHKRVLRLEYCQQAVASRWERKWKPVTIPAITGTKASATASSKTASPKTSITTFTLVRALTQFIGFVVFCGSLVYLEVSHAPRWSASEAELFAAVGQWSNVAVVLLVLLAAVIRRIWSGSEAESTDIDMRGLEEEGQISDSVETEDVEFECKDWDQRFGYAS